MKKILVALMMTLMTVVGAFANEGWNYSFDTESLTNAQDAMGRFDNKNVPDICKFLDDTYGADEWEEDWSYKYSVDDLEYIHAVELFLAYNANFFAQKEGYVVPIMMYVSDNNILVVVTFSSVPNEKDGFYAETRAWTGKIVSKN